MCMCLPPTSLLPSYVMSTPKAGIISSILFSPGAKHSAWHLLDSGLFGLRNEGTHDQVPERNVGFVVEKAAAGEDCGQFNNPFFPLSQFPVRNE